MRNRFDRQLDDLNRNLTEMGSCCEECIGQVAVALSSINEISRSHESGVTERLIEKIYESDAEIDKLERTIENQCLRLLLEQQPVALVQTRYILDLIEDAKSDIFNIFDVFFVAALSLGEMSRGRDEIAVRIYRGLEAHVVVAIVIDNAVRQRSVRHVDLIYARVFEHVLDDERSRQEQRCDHRRDLVVESKIRRSCLQQILIYPKELFLGEHAG